MNNEFAKTKNATCKHCNKLFENIKHSEFCNHSRWCLENPLVKNKTYSESNKKSTNKVLDKKFGEYKNFKVSCKQCSIEFEVNERKHKHPMKEHYFCNRKCANKFSYSFVDSSKISITLLANNITKKDKICKSCNTVFTVKLNRYDQLFCKLACKRTYDRSNAPAKRLYRNDACFKFALSDYPNEFDFNLIKQYGWYKATNRGNNITGVSRDHMYSVMDGFYNNIDPKILAHPANCRLLVHTVNIAKHKQSCITYMELLDRIKNWDNKYQKV